MKTTLKFLTTKNFYSGFLIKMYSASAGKSLSGIFFENALVCFD